MEQLTKDQQKKIIRDDLKSMSYYDLIDLSISISETLTGIGDITAKEYYNMVQSVIRNHRDNPWDKTCTYRGKSAKIRV